MNAASKPQLTVRGLLELIEHEAIVCEAYKDSVGEWTWGVGVTSKSGHKVYPRYYRKPTTIERTLEVFEWLVRTKYLPEVVEAFGSYRLNEHELAAALSFHWNTGEIDTASWVRSIKAGDRARAYREFLYWSKPREIIGRRKAERELFFNAAWTSDGIVIHYRRVSTSKHANPVWSSARQIDIRPDLNRVLAKARGSIL